MSMIVGHLMAFFMKYLRRKAILLDKVLLLSVPIFWLPEVWIFMSSTLHVLPMTQGWKKQICLSCPQKTHTNNWRHFFCRKNSFFNFRKHKQKVYKIKCFGVLRVHSILQKHLHGKLSLVGRKISSLSKRNFKENELKRAKASKSKINVIKIFLDIFSIFVKTDPSPAEIRVINDITRYSKYIPQLYSCEFPTLGKTLHPNFRELNLKG